MAGGFDALGCMPELIRAVTELGWYLPTDVQDEAIPLILGGGDVMVAAETGSGKTAAFALPLIQCCVEALRKQADASTASTTKHVESSSTREKVCISSSDKDPLLQLRTDSSTASGSSGKNWLGARCTHGVSGKGKYYYEARLLSDGLGRVGWSTLSGSLELGKDAHGFGYGSTAMKSNNSKFDAYGVKFGRDDVIGCMLDLDEGSIAYSVNGVLLGTAHELSITQRSNTLYPAFTVKGADITLNFGNEPFTHTPPLEYIAFVLAPSLVSASSGSQSFTQVKRTPLALIIEPVKDLAEQVHRDICALSQYVTNPSITSMLLVGGDDFKKQQRMLSNGVDILVGTPQKVADLAKRGDVDLQRVRYFIIDEADCIAADAESMANVHYLYNACPIGGAGDSRLQVCFFSATLHSPAIIELSKKICVNPTWVDLKGPNSIPECVHHVVYKMDLIRDARLLDESDSKVTRTDGVHALTGLTKEDADSFMIKRLKPLLLLKIIDAFNMSQCMIFCRTNLDCELLEEFFCGIDGIQRFKASKETGKGGKYSCSVLGGMRSIGERRAGLDAFREGSLRFLICTDVAARGIDIKGLPFVVNYTVPDEPESYIHRIGRVGRAEHLGLAISLVAPAHIDERVWYHVCANRGKGCSNTRLKSEGGCTVLYTENEYFDAIQRRLDLAIPELSEDYSLPVSLAVLGIQYGEKAVLEEAPLSQHLELIEPAVRELAAMEVQAQNMFLRYGSMFAGDDNRMM